MSTWRDDARARPAGTQNASSEPRWRQMLRSVSCMRRPWKTTLLCAGLPGVWWDASRWSLVTGPKGASARRDGGWRSTAEYWAQGHLGEEYTEVDDRCIGPCPAKHGQHVEPPVCCYRRGSRVCGPPHWQVGCACFMCRTFFQETAGRLCLCKSHISQARRGRGRM